MPQEGSEPDLSDDLPGSKIRHPNRIRTWLSVPLEKRREQPVIEDSLDRSFIPLAVNDPSSATPQTYGKLLSLADTAHCFTGDIRTAACSNVHFGSKADTRTRARTHMMLACIRAQNENGCTMAAVFKDRHQRAAAFHIPDLRNKSSTCFRAYGARCHRRIKPSLHKSMRFCINAGELRSRKKRRSRNGCRRAATRAGVIQRGSFLGSRGPAGRGLPRIARFKISCGSYRDRGTTHAVSLRQFREVVYSTKKVGGSANRLSGTGEVCVPGRR